MIARFELNREELQQAVRSWLYRRGVRCEPGEVEFVYQGETVIGITAIVQQDLPDPDEKASEDEDEDG